MPSLFKMNIEVDMIKSIMLGAREGFLWALRYIALLGLLFSISGDTMIAFYFILLYGIVIGAIPATLFGALTGGLVHFVLQQRPKQLSKAGLLGIKICLAVALPFHLLFLYFLAGPMSLEKRLVAGYYLWLFMRSKELSREFVLLIGKPALNHYI